MGLVAVTPTPSRGAMQFDLVISDREAIAVAIVDVRGRVVETLLHRQAVEAGVHRLEWDGDGWPAGVYWIRASGIAEAATIRTVLVR